MTHWKRFRFTIAIILTLLLTVVLAAVAVAQVPPGPSGPDDDGTVAVTPVPPVIGTPGPVTPGPVTPVPPVIDPPDPPDGNEGGTGASSGSWPPPNAIVRHAATPIQLSAHGGGLNVYFIAPDGVVTSGPVFASFSGLAEMHPSGGAVSLFNGANPGSGKSIEIVYLPDEMKIRVSTYYADSPPYDFNKPYVFTVDADHSVTHAKW